MRAERFLSILTVFVLVFLTACAGAPAPSGAGAPDIAAAPQPEVAEAAAATAAPAATATGTSKAVVSSAPTPTRQPLPPTVVSVKPERGEEQLISAPVVVTFDQPMDPASTKAAFQIEPQAPGDVEVEGNSLTFTPTERLARGQEYRITLASDAASATGLALQREVSFSFVTAGFLQVTRTQPSDGVEGVTVDTPIIVAFNRPVVPLTGAREQTDLPQPLVITPAVKGQGEWLNTSTYQFTPDTGLAASTQYSVTVEAGLTDTTGGLLAEPVTFSFRTSDPTIVRWLPENNLALRIEKPISVTFSMPMDQPSTEAAFNLTDSAGGAVAGTFSWNADGTEVAFKPTQVLKFGERYKATVATSAQAANGLGTLRDTGQLSYALQTVPLPRVVSIEPRNGSLTAAPDQTVRFAFAGPMNPASFVTDTITILPKPTRVYTYYNEFENYLFLDFQKAPATDYTITLAGKVADLYGNTLGEDYVVKFRTRNLDPMLQLNNQGIAGTYNAYTETQAVVAYRNMPEVRFDLYTVTLDEFIRVSGRDFWGNWEQFRPSPEARVREWSVPTKAEPNRLGYIREPLVDSDENPLAPGIYWLEVTGVELPNGQRPPRQLIVRTDLNVTIKASEEEVLAWVTDLKTGQPVAGATVRVADNGKNDLTATTDADGVARIKLALPRKVWEAIVAIATTDAGGFGAASVNWADGIAPWEFGVSSGVSNDPYIGYVYTDRPIYRPGQSVFWKAIVRRNNDVQYSLPPAGQPVHVTIMDAVGNTLLQQQMTLNALGAVDGQLELGSDATLGYYIISLRLPFGNKEEASFGVGFQVAEYRKPEYELSATTDKPEYTQGEQIRVTAQADYFFGGPVKNARVHWLAMTSDYNFTYQGEGYYSFSDWDWWSTVRVGPYGGAISEGEGRTDAQGRFTFTMPADITKYPSSQRFILDISVFDVNNQVVSTQANVVVHKGEFYIGLKPSSYVATIGEESQVDVLTVDPQSRPVADVEVEVTINQVEWRSVREQAEDGQFYWVTRPKSTPVITETVTTDANGIAALKWTPATPGEYKAEAHARDSKGHALRSGAYIWVSGRNFVAWRQENNDRIKLVADKDQYEVGETAEILIPSPYQGSVKALVTVERGRILSHQVIDLTSNSQVLQVPITAEHAPNAYVSVIIMKGIDETSPSPAFKMGMVPLRVSVADKELQIILTPRDAGAAPGAQAAMESPLRLAPRAKLVWEVKTLDAAGKPVSADVSLALVDKAVLTLAQDQTGTLLDRFYAQRGLGVTTGVTLALNVDRLVAQLAEEGKGGGGGGGDGGMSEVRTEFPDIAYWRASVTTDAQGVATVEVALPDNLTTWVMDARAATEDTRVGQNTVEVIATKALLIRPVLPRFFVAGDQAEIAGIIHNTTADALTVRVALAVTGLDVTGPRESSITVPAGETYKAVWPVKVQADAGEVKVRMTADAGAGVTKLGDAVEITLPVERYSTPEVIGTSGQVETGAEALELIRLPADIDPTRGDLTVNIEPSLAAGMTGALTFLEHFPYECVEQTISRFLPNVVSYQALQRLGVERPALATKLAQQVGVGLQRIYAKQHLDGGWGWWEKDESNPTVTAYVVFGMAKAQQADFTVDANALARAVEYLRGSLNAADELPNWQLNRQAFTLYALAEAGQPEPNRAGALFEQRERLDNFGQAYLALALAVINDEAAPERIKTLLADLSGKAITSATSAHWEEGQPDFWNMNTDTRSTAIVLAALAKLDPANALGPNVVRWLMTARKANAWETTQENAWAIIGLTEWMAATGELQGNYDWQATVNGQTLGEGTVTPQTVQDVTQLKADITQLLLDETNGLVISRTAAAGQTGAGQLYYTAHLRTYQPVAEVAPLNRGLAVTREYRLAECVQAQKTALQAMAECATVTKARVGDVLQARVTIVVPRASYYVIVEDPLPAGTEPVDTSLRITSQAAQGPEMGQVMEGGKDQGWDWWWTPTHVDLRDEKAVMFATNLEPGTYQFTYQVRATLPGTFLTLPPTAYQMYFPEVWGRGAGSTFVVTE